MTTEVGKSPASLLEKAMPMLSLRANLQVSWPESVSELVVSSQKEATKAG